MSNPIDLSDLPARYAYLAPVLRKHMTHFGDVDAYYDLLRKLQPGQLDELKCLYLEIEHRGDADDLSGWVVSQYPLSRKSGAGYPVFDLFAVFGLLAQENVEPFARRTVEIRDEIPCKDWSAVPSELGYLAEYAQKYGAFHAENQRTEFLTNATGADFRELEELARRIRSAGDAESIFDWIESSDLLDPQVARIAYLVELLRDARLDLGER